VEGKAI